MVESQLKQKHFDVPVPQAGKSYVGPDVLSSVPDGLRQQPEIAWHFAEINAQSFRFVFGKEI